MLQTGTIIEAAGGQLTIEFTRPEACEKCGQCNGSRHATRLVLPGQGTVGDAATVEMPDGRVAQASLLAYTVPLLLLLAGLLLAGKVQPLVAPAMNADLFTLLGALCGLLLAGVFLLATGRLLRRKADWQPRLVAVQPKDKN